MFKFRREQRICDIGGVKLGGQPGQLPTVLLGSIFYHGDSIVEDSKKGLFNHFKAESLLTKEKEESEKTGNPQLVDIVGAWPEAMINYIDFVVDIIDSPISLDCAGDETTLAAIKHVEETGLANRVLLNSINPRTKPEIVTAIKESGIKSAIFLALNEKLPTVSGRLDRIRDLLTISQSAGVENCLIDVTVLDVPDPGPASKAIFLAKKKYGLPSGCGAHNALTRWTDRKKISPTTNIICNTAIHVMPIVMGADFMLYGPISKAPQIYTACALADAYVSYTMQQHYGIKPLIKKHPRYKIF